MRIYFTLLISWGCYNYNKLLPIESLNLKFHSKLYRCLLYAMIKVNVLQGPWISGLVVRLILLACARSFMRQSILGLLVIDCIILKGLLMPSYFLVHFFAAGHNVNELPPSWPPSMRPNHRPKTNQKLKFPKLWTKINWLKRVFAAVTGSWLMLCIFPGFSSSLASSTVSSYFLCTWRG